MISTKFFSFLIFFSILILLLPLKAIEKIPEPPWDEMTSRVSIRRIDTGFTRTLEGMVFSGGSFFKRYTVGYSVFVIQHAKGLFLVDSGLGQQVGEQSLAQNWLVRKFILPYDVVMPAAEALSSQIPMGIFMTHLHWDHCSGLVDFPGVPVFVSVKEYDFAKSDKSGRPGYLKANLDIESNRWRLLNLKDDSFGPFASHLDIFGDHSIIAVSLEGHTPGSIGYVVNLENRKRVLFVGDAIWSMKQLSTASSKSYFSAKLADHNHDGTKQTVEILSKLNKSDPDLIIIPSHDFEQAERHFPIFEKH
jgi:glyoxylase-like metal-dependent hydrolase (beta-lactamase superfamily II)